MPKKKYGEKLPCALRVVECPVTKAPTTLHDLKQSIGSRQATRGRKCLYGVINCGSQRSLELIGIDDAVVYCRPWKSIGAAVSDIEHEECLQDIASIERHEAVIEGLMAQFSLLPARFGTVLSDAAQLDDLLRENCSSFCNDLHRLENKAQFDLKVLWPVCELRMLLEKGHRPAGAPWKSEDAATPGTRYALYKQRERAILNALKQKALEHADAVQKLLLEVCTESRCEVLPTEETMLSGSYLVERERCNDMREAVDALQAETPTFSFVLTGPWPPYSFMNLEERILKCEVV